MKKHSILHINSTISIKSGVMRVIMNYYKNINTDKIQFDFLYFINEEDPCNSYKNEIEKLGGKTYYISDFKRIISFNKKLGIFLDKNNKYSTVHIHDPFVAPIIEKTLREHGIKNIIIHSHATKWSDKKISAIRNKILCKNIARLADYRFSCSEKAGKFLFKNEKFEIIRNAIDVDKFKYNERKRTKIRNELGLKNNIVFGHVGNFNKQKNHHFLIQIISEIMQIDERAAFIFIGDGRLRDKIQRKVDELNLTERVTFLGKKKNVEDYYNAMDCLILPSLYEGFPMVGIESQCNGLPLIASDTITEEIKLNHCKLLPLNFSPKTWAIESLKATKKTYDRAVAKRIIEEKGYSIKTEALKLEIRYLEMEGEKC